MKKLFTLFALLVLIANTSFSQNVNVNPGGGSYATLKEAFDAINAGTHTGAITVDIAGNTTETVSAVLDSSGNGTSSSYTSITISPSGGVPRTITGAISGHLIALNGADNVTINGLNTGGNSLTISNTATGTSSSIRLVNDATKNTVTNCTITGSGTVTGSGVIVLSTGYVTGNNKNTFSNNDISASGSNLPITGIYSLGTSTTVDNDSNTVTGNNIYNFFSASSVSNGMNINTGNSHWTISNNKFYQTASRTYTTGNTHNGIVITSGSGYIITGNTIGYATSGGTGTYTMTGTIATRFIGINLSVGTTTAVTSLQGNTVTAISLATSSGAASSNGILCGINITGSGNVNIGNITPNVIGGASGTGLLTAVPTTTQGLIVGINTSSTGTIVIQNNVIGGFTSSGTTAAVAGGVAGINVSGNAASMTITGNTIGNSTAENMRSGTLGLTTGSSIASGIYLSSTPTVSNITNNTIRNFSSYGTGSSGYVRGIWTATGTGSLAVYTISGNTIHNFTTNSALATSTNGFTSANGIALSIGNAGLISSNTIYNISNINTGTSGYIVTGIGMANGTNAKAEKNVIYGLSNASTSSTVTTPGLAAGILVRSGTTSDTIVNNMISLGDGQTTNTSFIGIMCNHGSTPDPVNFIYYNSVYITGTVSSGAQPSMGFLRGDFGVTARTQTTFVKNNVFDNSRTGGTGKHYAIANNYGAVTSSTGWSTGYSDNNVLNSAVSTTIGYWTTDQTFAGWKSASMSDNASISGIPITYSNFAAGDLRLNMGVTPTQLESGAATISSITTDIDGYTRPKPAPVNGGGTAPDFGASESDMVPLDLTGPNISYTALINGPAATSRTINNFATITDLNGINVAPGTKPRVYYKKSTDADAFSGNTSGDNGWKWVEATNGATPFSFVIDYTIIFGGSVTAGDIIQYFVVAQDLSPAANLSSNPSLGFTGTSVASITSAPTTPNSYSILSSFPSVVYLGTGAGTPNYTSFSGAAGLFNAINTNVIVSDVMVIVQNNTVEDGTVSLNQFTPGYRIIVVPGAASVFKFEGTTAAANDALLEFNGADDFIIDGRFSNGGNYFRFINNNATASNTGPIIKFQNDSRRCGIGNTTFESNASASANPMILFSGTTGFLGNDSLAVDSCLFKNSTGTNPGSYFTAIGSTGTSTGAAKNSAIAIIQNNFTGWLATSTSIIDFSAGSMGDSLVIDTNRIYNNVTMTTHWSAIKLTGNGNNCTANFNSIGGSNPDRSGSPILALTGITMIGIDVKSGNTITSNLQGNVIANICNNAPASLISGITKGINIQGGRLNIGTLFGNTIGGGVNPWDTVTTAYDNGWIDVITASSSDTIVISNNTISYANYWRKRNDRNCAINIAGTSGSYIDVYNNSINNMKGNGTSNSSSFQLFGIRSANTGANTLINVRNNTIHTLFHTGDTAISANIHEPIGINFASGNATQTCNIFNNKIYNIQSNSTGTTDTGSTSPIVSGIKINSATSALNIYNNAISLATQTGFPTRICGIYNAGSSTTLNCNVYYNSVYIGGTATGTSPNTISYAFVRNTSGLTVLRNNIFYNSRGGGARNMAIGNLTSTNWTDTSSNYNLLVANSSTQCGEFTVNPGLNFTDWKTNSLGDAASIFETTTNLAPSNLWTNTANANLSLISAQSEAWFAAGAGTPITYPSVGSDISGNTRSTTIVGGATDIGCSEIGAPSATPPSVSNTITGDGTYDFNFGGKRIATIIFNPGTTGYPFEISLRHFGGVNPPGSTSQEFTNYFDSIFVSSGTPGTLNYDARMYIYGNILRNISDITKSRIAKSGDGGITWTPQLVNGSYTSGNPSYCQATNLNSFSLFTVTSDDSPLPVGLASFTANVTGREVALKWITDEEVNNSGFDLERKSNADNNWIKLTHIKGAGTTNSQTIYTYKDLNIPTGKYNYRLKQIDYNGNYEYLELKGFVDVGIPKVYNLSQNYPNPFNPTTKINYDLPLDSKVTLKVYDVTGREIYTALNNVQVQAGYNTINLNFSNFASGIYFYRINAKGSNGYEYIMTKKMSLIK